MWWLYRDGLPGLRFCYAGEIRDDLTSKYVLEPVKDGYKLTIRDLDVSDTGTYVCQWSRRDKSEFLVNVTRRSVSSETPEHHHTSTGKQTSVYSMHFCLSRSC